MLCRAAAEVLLDAGMAYGWAEDFGVGGQSVARLRLLRLSQLCYLVQHRCKGVPSDSSLHLHHMQVPGHPLSIPDAGSHGAACMAAYSCRVQLKDATATPAAD